MKIEHLLGLVTVCYNESKQLQLQKYPVNNKFLWAEWVIMPDGNSQITSAAQIYSVGRRLQPILLHVIFMTENSD